MKNRILKLLPVKEYKTILSQLKTVDLVQGKALYEAGERIQEVYFPDEATISYLSGTADGETLQVCVIGNEGVVGIPSLLADSTAFRAVVQLPGRAYAMRRDVLRKEFKRCEALHKILLHYTNALLIQIAQTAVCNKFHSVEERFCRWLLMANDRSVTDRVPLTQEALSRVLGSRRASVSVTASAFQKREPFVTAEVSFAYSIVSIWRNRPANVTKPSTPHTRRSTLRSFRKTRERFACGC
jgi:CRP-like cAMP-binding protein